MTKAELIEKIYKIQKGTVSKKMVGDVLETIFDTLSVAIKKDKRFSYPKFGTWTVKRRKARIGRNPQTGDVIKIPASRTVGFKPAPTLKKMV